MSKATFCNSCTWWKDVSGQLLRPVGICDHPLVEGKILVDRQQSTHEDGVVIYTDKCFGCIYHEVKASVVVENLSGMTDLQKAQWFAEKYFTDPQKICKHCLAVNCIENFRCILCDKII